MGVRSTFAPVSLDTPARLHSVHSRETAGMHRDVDADVDGRHLGHVLAERVGPRRTSCAVHGAIRSFPSRGLGRRGVRRLRFVVPRYAWHQPCAATLKFPSFIFFSNKPNKKVDGFHWFSSSTCSMSYIYPHVLVCVHVDLLGSHKRGLQ